MKHITFDLETLGNGPNSPIIQIGAARFNNHKILDTFKVNVDWNDLKNYDFEIDYDTIHWWMSQSDAARESVTSKDTKPLDVALEMFMEWVHRNKVKAYWSHATFDAPILANACRKAGVKLLPFRNQRDIRTLNMLAGDVKVERPGTHHDAEDDAIFQALYIIEMLNVVNNG